MKKNIRIQKDRSIIFSRARLTTGFMDRLQGLLGTTSILTEEPLIIDNCSSVHSFFMKYTIGVIHLNSNNAIIGYEVLPPHRIGRMIWGTKKVIECHPDAYQDKHLKIGDRILFY
ncbi:MAG: hypothetical protein DKM50_12680 [Candidatus Margulisiibacteriota bacterium]|nr:MAG: hypothetical protein A2X43_11140 [Candidatus Margulisbacteria bacterium GWD2_39_127]OGI02784.1 MAG: hypothetical protein A2X42_01965 [Candidatus Margulisbacteria bacterium GWF2_38_17]OGI09329.1 MAG: hypothetical protein A2X41_09410 [Candidatus Margulisbacteria bacterium GWE2_39_32]PZM77457.1 MAG: hypothetical protein DKM50_12680 [Candidatus Margulisiibacteriota bacterium]HAR63980.1 hypothetical protein [Candidatus Margulisiibacteriota bacterium]